MTHSKAKKPNARSKPTRPNLGRSPVYNPLRPPILIKSLTICVVDFVEIPCCFCAIDLVTSMGMVSIAPPHPPTNPNPSLSNVFKSLLPSLNDNDIKSIRKKNGLKIS